MDQQIDRINLLGGQATSSQPDTLPGFLDPAPEGSPTVSFIEPEQGIGILTQNIEPPPVIQLSQDGHSAEFAVTDQKNGCSFGDQLANISQQSQLLAGRAVSLDMLDPGPGDGNSSFAIGQAHDQQLMPETNLGTTTIKWISPKLRY